MKHNNNQQGFSTIVVIVLLLALAGAGFTGWYVWQNKAKQAASNTNATQQAQQKPTTATPTTNTKPADPTEGGKYLVIKEWGVRFPLSNELRGDVKYGIFTFQADSSQAAYFASNKIAAHAPGGPCDLTSSSQSTGTGTSGGTISVVRSSAEPTPVDERTVYHSAGYWYVVDFSNGGSCYNGDTGQEKAKFNELMQEALKQLGPVNAP